MMESTYVQKFHALGGSTISEHKKLFNAYSRELNNANIHQGAFFAQLTPRNRQEQIFKIKLLQQHGRHQDLFQILLTGDKVNGNVILKDGNFLSIFANVTGDAFVDEICPKLSYVAKVKIINKLAFRIRDDGYFAAVLRKYGLKMATPLVLGCGEDVLKELVRKFDIRLNQRFLIELHKRFPNFLRFYYARNPVFGEHRRLALYLSRRDLPTYWDLLRFGVPKLGKRTLPVFLRGFKAELIKDCGKYGNLLRAKALRKVLTQEEYIAVMKGFLPKSADDFNIEVISGYLKVIPKVARGAALFRCFKDTYGFDIWLDSAFTTAGLLRILSADDRSKFELVDFAEMLPVEQSIPKLKGLLAGTTNPQKKVDLQIKLLETCEVNEDPEALLGVLEYFCEDKNPLPMNVFVKLCEAFALEKLDAAHWVCIEELLRVHEINNVVWYGFQDPLEICILYKMLNGLDYDGDLRRLCKKRGVYKFGFFDDKHPKYERECMRKVALEFEELYKGADVKTTRRNFIVHLARFNIRHPKLSIGYGAYADLLRSVVREFETEKYFYYGIPELLAMKPIPGEDGLPQDMEVLDGIMKYLHKSWGDRPYLWFLKHTPELVAKYARSFFKAKELSTNVYYEIAKMHYTSVHKTLVTHALELLSDSNNDAVEISSSIKVLASVTSIDFLELTKPYLPPPDCKIDSKQANIKSMLTIQKSMIKSLKRVSIPEKIIPTIIYLARGDYLRHVLEPLYYAMHYSPEPLVDAPMRELLTRAVSVRKHTLHLVTAIGPPETRYEILKNLAETETNASLKNFIFRKLHRSLVEERSQRWFDLFKANIHLLDINDCQSHVIYHLKTIPKAFYSDYLEVISDRLESLGRNGERSLLKEIEYGTFLGRSMSERIIKHCLFKESSKINEFVWKYLLSDKELLDESITFVINCTKFELSQTAISKQQQFEEKAQHAKNLRTFVANLCAHFLATKREDFAMKLAILDRFAAEESFQGYQLALLLAVTKLQFTTDDDDLLDALAGFAVEYRKQSEEKFGPDIVAILGDYMRSDLETSFGFVRGVKFELFLRLVEGVMRLDQSVEGAILSLFLLPRKRSKNAALVRRYEDVIGRIGAVESDVVRVCLKWYLGVVKE